MSSLSTWPTDAQAAAALSTSVKTIHRYAKRGKIEMRKRPRPGRKPENVCNPRDIEQLKPAAFVLPDEAEVIEAEPIQPTEAEPAGLQHFRQAPADPFETIIRTIATAIETKRTEHPAEFLTVKEAAAFLRMPRKWVIFAIETKRLPAALTGRGWRVQRRALEAFKV